MELGAGKAKMELERVHGRADGMEEPGGVHSGARGMMNPGRNGRMRYPNAVGGMTGHGKAKRSQEPPQERGGSMCGSPFQSV